MILRPRTLFYFTAFYVNQGMSNHNNSTKNRNDRSQNPKKRTLPRRKPTSPITSFNLRFDHTFYDCIYIMSQYFILEYLDFYFWGAENEWQTFWKIWNKNFDLSIGLFLISFFSGILTLLGICNGEWQRMKRILLGWPLTRIGLLPQKHFWQECNCLCSSQFCWREVLSTVVAHRV